MPPTEPGREAAVTDLAVHLHRKGVGCDGHVGDDPAVADVMHRDDAYDIYDQLAELAIELVAQERATPPPTDPTAALRTAMLDYDMLAQVLLDTAPADWPGGEADRPYDAPHRAWAARIVAHPAYRAAFATSQADDPSGPDALDVERLRDAFVTVEAGYILAHDRTARAYWTKFAEAYAAAALRESPDGE